MAFQNINIRKVVETSLLEDAIIVDVRPENRFQSGHIPMAVNVPLERIEAGQMHLPKSRKLVLYCDTGGASIQAARILDKAGYSVINCVGGLGNYKASLTK